MQEKSSESSLALLSPSKKTNGVGWGLWEMGCRPSIPVVSTRVSFSSSSIHFRSVTVPHGGARGRTSPPPLNAWFPMTPCLNLYLLPHAYQLMTGSPCLEVATPMPPPYLPNPGAAAAALDPVVILNYIILLNILNSYIAKNHSSVRHILVPLCSPEDSWLPRSLG